MTTTDPRARLDGIKARADAATEGPWFAHPAGKYIYDRPNGQILDGCVENTDIDAVANTEFIAHARTDVPAMAAALTAVLDLHKPLNGPHEHLVCAHRHCIDDAGDQCRWPCMTARAITEKVNALKETGADA